MTEIWKDIKGYEGLYKISNHGEVWSTRKQGLLKKGEITSGYYIVSLTKNKKLKSFTIHRLVAINFIDNPFNKPCVNHIDENKKNNHYSNLEWVTNKENVIHAYKNNLNNNRNAIESRKRKVDQFTLENELIKTYNSIEEATKVTKINNISAVCRGCRNKAGGFKWRYSTDFGGDSNVSK